MPCICFVGPDALKSRGWSANRAFQGEDQVEASIAYLRQRIAGEEEKMNEIYKKFADGNKELNPAQMLSLIESLFIV